MAWARQSIEAAISNGTDLADVSLGRGRVVLMRDGSRRRSTVRFDNAESDQAK